MTTHPTTELGHETDERSIAGRHLESLDDIAREIADRRLRAEYSESIPVDKLEIIRNVPDRIEKPDDFKESARKADFEHTDGLLGWSTNLESAAHVLKGEVPKEIATLIHEDLHRLTHPETMREMTSDPALREIYEGITEYLTEQAVEGLHRQKSGECYPEHVSQAEKLAAEVGETALRRFFFENKSTDEIVMAIEIMANRSV